MGSAEVETFRFLMLGKTGSGKSSTGNTILGQDLFDAEVSFVSVTDECQLKSASNLGANIEIMDCPGLFDTAKSNEDVAAVVMKAFSAMTSGPDAICYVIEVGSYTEEEFGVYNRLKAVLDDQFIKYLLLVFTHGDRLGGKGIQELLKQAPTSPLNEILAECGHRHVVVDNTRKAGEAQAQAQVKGLLDTVRAMKTANGGRPYQCPGYVSAASDLAQELTSRLGLVGQSEAAGKKYTQRLNARLDQTQETAAAQRQELTRKAQEMDAQVTAKETSLQQQVNDASARLSQQQQSVSAQTSQLQALQARQAQEAQQRQQQLQQQQAQHAAAMQQKANEIAALR